MLEDRGLKLARILLLLGGWVAAPVFGGTFAVESTEPPRNAGNVAPTSAITIHFDRAVSVASVSAASLRAYGRQSGPVSGTFTFLPGGLGVRLRPGRPFVPGETVLVNLCLLYTSDAADE